MSELLQSGQHPDADQLSAFIEHALPAHEQEETLAHLAICPHCRSIVALSMPPAEELLQPHPEPARRRWLSGWMMVWPAGAALAALLLAGIYIRNGLVVQSHVPSAQTAQSRPPEQPKPLPPTPTLKLQARGSAVPQAAAVPETTTQAADRLMPFPGGGGNELHTNQNRLSSFGASKGPSGAVAAQSSTVISDGGATQAIRTESPTVGGILGVDQAQVVPGRHGLPSGLRALSTVANARQVVAIDTDNTLFFSNDAGARWNVITPPWQGRAVKVELVPTSYSVVTRNGAVAAAPADIVGGMVDGPKAALTGEITDPTGASIPSASVTVTNSLTQVVHRTTTDAAGRYTVDQLDPGTYTLEAEAPGFTPREVSGLSLNPAQQSQKDLTLAVGALAQTVEVQGQPQPALAAPRIKEKIAAARAAAPPVPRFEITTDAGEHWISTDGRSWQRKDEDTSR
jgi:Carboxypeptidase regulatory-like domain/Putative zinc-finger